MYAIRSYYGIDHHHIGAAEQAPGAGELLLGAGQSQSAVAAGDAERFEHLQIVAGMVQTALRLADRDGMGQQEAAAVAAVTGRITSYNVCYTKLLRR